MFKIKFTAMFLSTALLLCGASVLASADFGSGAAVIAQSTALVKGGYSGEKICFSDVDFKSALGVTDFKKITVVSTPKAEDGILLYAGRRVCEGLTVKRRNIPSLVFIPASDAVKEARFSFIAEGFADSEPIECILRFAEKKNSAPTVVTQASTLSISKSQGKLVGKVGAHDPDGDSVEFLVASFPKHGFLEFSSDGTYCYTSIDKKPDSFSYVARDSFGNFSEVAKIKIEV